MAKVDVKKITIDFVLDKKTFNIEKTLKNIKELIRSINLDKYAKEGLELLKKQTPVDSGKTAESWKYRIEATYDDGLSIKYYNDNLSESGTPIVIYLQYGHVSKNGGWVEGIDFINPATKPPFLELVNKIWNEVRSQ